MTRDEFKIEFKRLCDGFSYQPRQTQVEAFYERLQHCQRPDWHEAVTDLLCAPRFPMNLEIILETIEKRAEQRRRHIVKRDHDQAHGQAVQLVQSLDMRDALAERPELLASIERILTHGKPMPSGV